MDEVKSKEFKYAVSSGITVLSYDDKGDRIFIGGSGGALLETKDYDDADPAILEADDDIYTLDCKGDLLVVGTEDHKIIAFDLTEEGEERSEQQKIITKFSLPVRSLSLDATGTSVAAGSDDGKIKVVNIDGSDGTIEISGHDEHAIRSISYDPLGEYLISASCDGKVGIWNIREEGREVMMMSILAPLSDPTESPSLCYLDWHPDGSKFAVPVKKDIHVYERDSWRLVKTLKHQRGHNEEVSIVKWSTNGRHLASSSVDGHTVVWDFSTSTPISSCNRPSSDSSTQDSCVTSLGWHPSKSDLLIANKKGEWSVWENVIPVNVSSIVAQSRQAEETRTSANENAPVGNNEPPVTLNTDNIDVAALLDDEAENEMDQDDMEDEAFGDDIGTFVVDDPPPVHDAAPSVTVYKPKVQAPFQPGSTPIHNGRRYLTWNMVGVIVAREESGQMLIDIEFNDLSSYRNVHIPDQFGLTHGCLNMEGAFFASTGDPTVEDAPPQVYYRQHKGWSTNEWSSTLSPTDVPTCIAIGATWAAVATNKRYLHIFSMSGINIRTICLEGDVISMIGNKDELTIVYSCPTLRYTTYKLKHSNISVISEEKTLPISPKADLKWLGYTEFGCLATFDSELVCRVLTPHGGWMPILDCTRAQGFSKSEGYWIVGISEEHILSVFLKDREHPVVTPRPPISPLPIQSLIIDDSSQLEQNYKKSRLVTDILHSKKIMPKDDKTVEEEDAEEARLQSQIQEDSFLLKLIQMACKQDKGMRVLDLAAMLNLSKSKRGAIRCAQHEKLSSLAGRLNQQCELQEEENDNEISENNQLFKEKVAEKLGELYEKANEHEKLIEEQIEKQSEFVKTIDSVQKAIDDVEENSSEMEKNLAELIEETIKSHTFQSRSTNEGEEVDFDLGSDAEDMYPEDPHADSRHNPFRKVLSPPSSGSKQAETIFDAIQSVERENEVDIEIAQSKKKGNKRKETNKKTAGARKAGATTAKKAVVSKNQPKKSNPFKKPAAASTKGSGSLSQFLTKFPKPMKRTSENCEDDEDEEEIVSVKRRDTKRTKIIPENDSEDDDNDTDVYDDDIENETPEIPSRANNDDDHVIEVEDSETSQEIENDDRAVLQNSSKVKNNENVEKTESKIKSFAFKKKIPNSTPIEKVNSTPIIDDTEETQVDDEDETQVKDDDDDDDSQTIFESQDIPTVN